MKQIFHFEKPYLKLKWNIITWLSVFCSQSNVTDHAPEGKFKRITKEKLSVARPHSKPLETRLSITFIFWVTLTELVGISIQIRSIPISNFLHLSLSKHCAEVIYLHHQSPSCETYECLLILFFLYPWVFNTVFFTRPSNWFLTGSEFSELPRFHFSQDHNSWEC